MNCKYIYSQLRSHWINNEICTYGSNFYHKTKETFFYLCDSSSHHSNKNQLSYLINIVYKHNTYAVKQKMMKVEYEVLLLS